MPLYYFDIVHGSRVEEDHKGKHAADPAEAREIALRSVVDLLEGMGKAATDAAIEIRDLDRNIGRPSRSASLRWSTGPSWMISAIRDAIDAAERFRRGPPALTSMSGP